MSEDLRANAAVLQAELDWLQRVIDGRMRLRCGEAPAVPSIFGFPPPELGDARSAYARFVQERKLSPHERLLLILALAPHLRPQALDVLLCRNSVFERQLSEVGGVVPAQGGFLPTVDTALFLIAGDDLPGRLELCALLESGHPLVQHQVLRLEPVAGIETLGSARLVAAPALVEMLAYGKARRPELGPGGAPVEPRGRPG